MSNTPRKRPISSWSTSSSFQKEKTTEMRAPPSRRSSAKRDCAVTADPARSVANRMSGDGRFIMLAIQSMSGHEANLVHRSEAEVPLDHFQIARMRVVRPESVVAEPQHLARG